jgi:ribose transport system substrate-binding protein
MTETSAVAPANKKIGVSVAYLKVPFYANFKTGLEDGAKQFGFTYDLVDGNSGDVATELANLQNFMAQKKDLILLTPSGQGIIPGIKLVNDASIPIIEVNNKAGFGSGDVNVLTYAGADDVEFGRLQGKLLDQAFGGNKAKVAYVMGFAGTSPQILRAKGWDEFRAQHPQYEEVVRSTDDFDAAKALAVVQDLLSRFPKGQLDAIGCGGLRPAPRWTSPSATAEMKLNSSSAIIQRTCDSSFPKEKSSARSIRTLIRRLTAP